MSLGRGVAPRDPVSLAGGQSSALSLHLQSRALEPAAKTAPSSPSMGPWQLQGRAVCTVPCRASRSPQTNTRLWDTAHGGPGLSGYSVLFWGHSRVPVASDSTHSSMNMLAPPPRVEPWFLLHGMASPWLQCSTCFPTACTGAQTAATPCAQRSPFSQSTGQGVLSGGSSGERQALMSSTTSQHPGTRHAGPGSWRTGEIRVMKPQGQMMLSAPETIPKSWCSPPCLPHGMQPLPLPHVPRSQLPPTAVLGSSPAGAGW